MLSRLQSELSKSLPDITGNQSAVLWQELKTSYPKVERYLCSLPQLTLYRNHFAEVNRVALMKGIMSCLPCLMFLQKVTQKWRYRYMKVPLGKKAMKRGNPWWRQQICSVLFCITQKEKKSARNERSVSTDFLLSYGAVYLFDQVRWADLSQCETQG